MLDKKSKTAGGKPYFCGKQERSMISISFDTIFDKAVEFSAYEAGRGVQDKSLLPTLLVTAKDKPFIQSHAEQAMLSVGSLLRFCLEDFGMPEDGAAEYRFTFREDCVLARRSGTKRHLTEAMATFVMSQWLGNKLPERAQAYASMHADMAGALVSSADRTAPRPPKTNK